MRALGMDAGDGSWQALVWQPVWGGEVAWLQCEVLSAANIGPVGAAAGVSHAVVLPEGPPGDTVLSCCVWGLGCCRPCLQNPGPCRRGVEGIPARIHPRLFGGGAD